MAWLAFALGATFLWSVSSFVDKLLIERFTPERSVALALGIYSGVFSLCLLPFLFYFNQHVFSIEALNALLFIATGILEITAIILYLRALQHEDTSTVVPFFQTIPVFSFILGFLILGETISGAQALSGLGIILGGILLSLEISKDKKVSFRLPLILLMVGASVCYALFDAVFKYAALREDFWSGVFWQHVGIALSGFFILLARKRYRERFLKILRGEGALVFGVNVANESLYAGGMMLSNYALLLAPIVLVSLVNVYQPVFVFIIGMLITVLAPRILKEQTSRAQLLLKILSIIIILISSIFLVLATGS